MKRQARILVAAACVLVVSVALASDTGKKDVLRLTDGTSEEGLRKIAVHVINDEDLAALDIPIRYGRPGDPIELERVDFAGRVADWDFVHAKIDKHDKTVILGLISELVNMRPDADMKVSAAGNTRVADLVFRVGSGYTPRFETFTTENPGHELTFLYNEDFEGQLIVRSIVPEFEVNVSSKNAVLPTEYALSQNYPNPFNPTTDFTLSLPEASDYAVRIFNVAGQLVKTYDGHLEAGLHTLTWDGTNDQNNRVASGAYFLSAHAGSFSQTRKMTLLK